MKFPLSSIDYVPLSLLITLILTTLPQIIKNKMNKTRLFYNILISGSALLLIILMWIYRTPASYYSGLVIPFLSLISVNDTTAEQRCDSCGRNLYNSKSDKEINRCPLCKMRITIRKRHLRS